MTKYPLKLIIWHDAFNGDHIWFPDKELGEYEPYIVETAGFEVQRSDEHITLSMSVSNRGQLCDLFTIPLALVVKEETLRDRSE